MFKAISNYDGSDTSKCISLAVGDSLLEVHTLDEIWFIGFNERTKETGVFPISCVEAIISNDHAPVSAKLRNVNGQDDPKIYPNVAGHTRDLGSTGDDLGPVSRSRALYNHAKLFDAKRLQSGKTGIDNNEGHTDTDVSNGRRHYDSTNQKSVQFESNQLQHLISVPESIRSCQDSSFAHSLDDVTADIAADMNKAEFKVDENTNKDDKGHKLKRGELRTIKSSTARIFNSAKNENKGLKALFGAISGLIIGGLFYLVLVFSFDYSYLVAGIIDAVATVFFIVCLAFSPLCRCIMALVFPNFFTGKGRAVFLSIIFGLILSHPIVNINTNIQETSKSLACVTELAVNQSRALQKQLNQPVDKVMAYIADQKAKLDVISDSLEVAFGWIGTALDEVDKQVGNARKAILSVRDDCRKPFIDGWNECVNTCNKIPVLLKEEVDKIIKYFEVDMKVIRDFSGSVNQSKSAKSIQDEVNKKVTVVFDIVKKSIFYLKLILSFSLVLIFVQSFLYLRKYLAKDAFDNVYITHQFKQMDQDNIDNGMDAILPLKKKERSIYVDTSSFKLNASELAHCRLGLAQVFLHFVVCSMVFLFDYGLYFILILIKNNGDIQVEFENQGRFIVKVTGDGLVAYFYKIIVDGFDLDHTYNSNLDVRFCLPNPGKPSATVIPTILSLYLITILFVILRGYGMRLRPKIAAYYYPEQEKMRLDYLHKKIRHKRVGFLKFLRHQIMSAKKKIDVKKKLRISTWCCFQSSDKLECMSCEQKESRCHGVVLTKCPGEVDGMPCDAAYCQECRVQLINQCPLCTTNDIVLRD